MTLNDFEAVLTGLRKSFEVDYDAESEHAYVETPGGTVSIAFVRKPKQNFVSLAPRVKMSLRNLIKFLTTLNETVDSLGLEEAVIIRIPGSYYRDDEDEFQMADAVKVTVPGHLGKTKPADKPKLN